MIIGFIFRCLLLFNVTALPSLSYAHEAHFFPLARHPNADTVAKHIPDSLKQIDLYDLIASISGRKNFTSKKDSVGAKPVVSIIPALGYTLQSKIAITLAGNIAFRLSKETKISTIIINTAYTQTKQIIIPIQSSIWAHNNDYNFVGDIRYLKYPESTYGLGSSSNIANQDPMDYSFVRFNEIVLRKVLHNFFLGAGYIFDDHYNITHKGTSDGAIAGYTVYGAESSTRSSGFTLNELYDSRDNPINAARGWYASIQFRDNMTGLGSTRKWESITIDARKYYKFPAGSDNVLALWSYDWLVLNGKPPYLDLPSNTWDIFSGTGRGYIQGRFRGAQMVYLESEYRYKISRNGLIGGVFFVNAESFSAAPGTQLQAIQPAFGPGLRIKLNKVSKTNIAIDYGIGRQGSRGVFINVGEIF